MNGNSEKSQFNSTHRDNATNPEQPHKVVVVGIVRDVERMLSAQIGRLNSAFEGCEVSWFLVESDSSDGTLEKLSALKKIYPRFDFVSLGNLEDTLAGRTQRLARCRNRYLQEIRSNPVYSSMKVVCVADFDGVNRKISGFPIRRLLADNSWDACFANQKGPYYDVWALRASEWSPDDCWKAFKNDLNKGIGEERSRKKNVISRMREIPRDGNWIPVRSAFGGFAMYRRDLLIVESYSGGENYELCEHVPLNSGMEAKGARLFIIPFLINCGVTEHSFEATRFGSLLPSRVAVKIGSFLWSLFMEYDNLICSLKRACSGRQLGTTRL